MLLVIPCIIALLPGRSSAVYQHIFDLLNDEANELGLEFKPKILSTDFEPGLVKAIQLRVCNFVYHSLLLKELYYLSGLFSSRRLGTWAAIFIILNVSIESWNLLASTINTKMTLMLGLQLENWCLSRWFQPTNYVRLSSVWRTIIPTAWIDCLTTMNRFGWKQYLVSCGMFPTSK